MNKPLIICVVGESGSGKTSLCQQIADRYGIEQIQSYTDRPKRTEDETGHTFLTKDEFDKLNKDEMIAWTEWVGYRYCCLKQDVKDLNTYTIDEKGLDYLLANFSDLYEIKSIRIVCSEQERIRRVGQERVSRDAGMFSDDYAKFNLIYNSERHSSFFSVPIQRYCLETWFCDFVHYSTEIDNLLFMQ